MNSSRPMDCFPSTAPTFWLRSDFPLEFCFDDRLRIPPTEATIRDWFGPGGDITPLLMAQAQEHTAEKTLHWCHAYLGIIDAGQVLARPYIWDGFCRLRVPEEGLFRAMLNRVADVLDQSRGSHPIIYPRTLVNPAKDPVFPEWVVLHDSTRSLAGVVRYEHALPHLRALF